MNFESADDFYYLQILQRKKENKDLDRNSRVIKNYYIKNLDYLFEKYDEIMKLCKEFNARASIRLNKRSFRKVAFKAMELTCNVLSNRTYDFVSKCYDRACGQSSNETTNKKWILDVDYPFKIEELNNYLVSENINILAHIPSKSGMHIITNPFNIKKFLEKYNEIEIHKDNPTNLYIP